MWSRKCVAVLFGHVCLVLGSVQRFELLALFKRMRGGTKIESHGYLLLLTIHHALVCLVQTLHDQNSKMAYNICNLTRMSLKGRESTKGGQCLLVHGFLMKWSRHF